jgi:phage protein D
MSENKHLTPVFIVYVDGRRLDTEHEGALKTITIADCLNGMSQFSLVFETGGTKIKEKELLALESEVSIHLGYKDDVEEVFYGEITSFCGIFPENGPEQLEVCGNNVLHKLTRASHFRSYEKKKPSEIIKGMLESYSLKAEVDDFGIACDFQSEENRSDFDYLIETAGMYGKQVFADKSTVYVKDEITVRTDEVILEWGKSLIKLDSTQDIKELVSGVDFIGWDNQKNESFLGKGTLADIPVKVGGSNDWTKISKGGSGNCVSSNVDLNLHDSDEARQLAVGRLQSNSYSFNCANGKCEGNYKIRPGMRINIKMVGEDFEGEYMADAVTHCFDRKSGYITEFALKRNMCG